MCSSIRFAMMGGGGFANTGAAAGHVSAYLVRACVAAASGGLLFGYAIGIVGGVSGMDGFFEPFFPNVHVEDGFKNNYCQYRNQTPSLRVITASFYLAGMAGAWAASILTEFRSRRSSIAVAAISLACGTLVSAIRQNMAMLMVGRVFVGTALGFGYQSVPLYLSEMAPANRRGGLTMMFQLAISIGILCASLVNYGASKMHPWGWRLFLGLATLPAFLYGVGALFLPETPISLIWRDKFSDGRESLQKIRGTDLVNDEYQDLVDASRGAKEVLRQRHPLKISPVFERRHRPYLVMAILLPFFQVSTGIGAVLLYIPHVFNASGFGEDAALYSALVIGITSSISTVVSMVSVDRLGRKALFFGGGMQMFFCQAFAGVLLKYKVGLHDTISWQVACAVLIMLNTSVAAFSWSWGSLGWTVPSEMFPLEIRSTGQSLVLTVNFLCTFCMDQVLLEMMCTFQHLTFLYFAGWILIMTCSVWCLLPETGGVPIEGMVKLWRRHWFWERYYRS